jgi:septal ring factor EnvC (AmiA/AmiB activator)
MDFKTLLTIVRGRFLVPTIIVGILCIGGMTYVWAEYKALLKEKDAASADRKALYDERVAFEKMRADSAASQASRETELQKREYTLQQNEQRLKESMELSQKKSDELNASADRLRITAAAVSQAERLRDAESKLQRLMGEFSAMGVDLNNTPCGDPAATKSFNAAKSKFSEALALAEASGLYEKYKHFFFKNSQHMVTLCSK